MESRNTNQISIDIPNYTGSLEILLDLAKSQKVDLANISVEKLADQFLDFIKNDKTYLEREPLEKVAKKKQLSAYKHSNFWQCMDTLRDKENIEKALKKDI